MCVHVCQLSELVMYEDFARIWCVIIKRVTPIFTFQMVCKCLSFFFFNTLMVFIQYLT